MDFSSHRLQSDCSKCKPLGLSNSSKCVPENVIGTDNQSATVLPLKQEILDQEDNLYDKEESNIIFRSPSNTATTHSANIDSSTIPDVSEQKSEQQIIERILEKLYTAYQNLCPVIDEIISNATECTETLERSDCTMCSVTHEQYIGAIKASQLIQEVHNDVIQSGTFNLELIKGDVMDLPAADFIVNSVHNTIYANLENTLSGTSIPRIYIEQNVVNQLIELYNLLHGALEQLSEIAKDEQIPVDHTKLLNKNCSSVFKLLHSSNNQFKLSESSSTDNPENSKLLNKLQEEYQGLSDAVDMLKSIIKETSGSVGDIKKLGKSLQDARKTKSDNSMAEIEKSKKITDVSGARRCILECLVELAEVRKYLKNADNTKDPNVVSQICLTADLKRECCSKQNIPHLHAKLNGIPIVVKLNQETVDTILSSVGSSPPYNINEDTQTGIVGSNKYKICVASKSSPFIKSSGQSIKLISSDEKEWSSKPRQECGCKQKYSTKLERELSLRKINFHQKNKKQTKLIIPNIQVKKSQSFTGTNKKPIKNLYQSCKSLDSLLNNQQQMKPSKRQTLKQCASQGDYLAIELHSQTFFDNQKMLEKSSKSISGKTIKKLKTAPTTIPKVSKKKSQLAKRFKRKASGSIYDAKYSNSGKLLEMSCCIKRKNYTRNNSKTALHQVESINKDTINNANEETTINTIKKRINKSNGTTCSTKNIDLVCYESDNNLITDKNEKRKAIPSSSNFLENNEIEGNSNFEKLFKDSTKQQEMKLPNQTHTDSMNKENDIDCKQFTFDTKHEISQFSGKLNNKQETTKLFGSSSSNNATIVSEESDSSSMLLTASDKQQGNIKSFDDFSENYANNVHQENDNSSKLFTSSIRQDNIQLLNNFPKNNEDDCKLNNSFIEKFKQQINKLADKISPKITDSVPEKINNLNTLIIDEIQQQEIFKLFNTSLVKNSNKLHKEGDSSTKPTNSLTSKEKESNTMDRNFKINDINTSPEKNCKLNKSFTDKTKQEINKLLSNNLHKAPEDRNIVEKPEIKQKRTIKLYDDVLMKNFGTAYEERSNLNQHLTFASKQQKTLISSNSADATNMHNKVNTSSSVQANKSVKKSITCNTENSLPFKKTIQYKTLALVKSQNYNHANRLIINLNAKSNYELTTTSQLLNIGKLKINKKSQSCSESKTNSQKNLHEKNNQSSLKSDSELNIPYVVSIKSIPKIKMEKVRPNSKFTTKNILPQNDGIYDSNKKIKRQLEEIGIQNILQAASPAKCCRKTVLNKKSPDFPYQVSLSSLPLNAADTNAVNKLTTKHFDNIHSPCYSKLNYYSNLETSFKRTLKNTYEVRYFELKSNFQSDNKSVPPSNNSTERNKTSEIKGENKSSHPVDSKFGSHGPSSTSEYPKNIPPWGQTFEVRVFEYERKGSDTDLPMAMSNRKGTTPSPGTSTGQQPRTSKSKYYSYPDEEDYIRNFNRKSMAERRPDDEFPRAMNRRTTDRRADTASVAPHRHGESRLGLEPWAPFAISDTSLPGTRNTKNNKTNNPPYQGWGTSGVPETSSQRSANMPLQNLPKYKGSEIPNQNKGASPRSAALPLQNSQRPNQPSQNAGGTPVLLTPELLERLTKGNKADRLMQDADVNSLFRNTNFSRGIDEFPYGNNMLPIHRINAQHTNRHDIKCCPFKTCTVSTDTDDIDFEYSQKCPKGITGAPISHFQQKQSLCLQCDLSKANVNEFAKKPLQRPCSKQSPSPEETSTYKSQSKYQTTRNARDDTRKELCKCGITKDLCLCDYAKNCKLACGTKVHNENKMPHQQFYSSADKYQTNNYEYSRSYKTSHNQDKTSKTATDKADQHRKGAVDCINCYNHNPRVMYYLGEQRTKVSKTISNCSDNHQPVEEENIHQKSNVLSKLSSSREHSVMVKNKCTSADACINQNPKQQTITEKKSKTQKSIIHQENIIQYCLEPQSNTMKVPFHQKVDQYDSHKILIDKYYLLCLPNELSSSNENFFNENSKLSCSLHSAINTPCNNSAKQVENVVHKHEDSNKQDENHCQYENISTMLKSYLNSNSNSNSKEKSIGTNKKLLEPNKSIDKLSSEKCNDSTIYVFPTESKSDKNKCLIIQQNQSNLIRDVSPETDVPTKENITLNVNQKSTTYTGKESKTENLKDINFESLSDIDYQQIVDVNRHYLSEQKENSNKVNSKESDIFKQIDKELNTLKDDCKRSISLVDNSHSQNITRERSKHKHNQNVTNQKPSQDKKNLKHIQYRSIGINTDSVNESVSETFTLNQSYSDVCSPPDESTEPPMNLNSANETLNMPEMKQLLNYNTSDLENALGSSPCGDEALLKGWTQQSSMLLKQVGTAIANVATEMATNKATDENKHINKQSAETIKNESRPNIDNVKEHCNNKLYSMKDLIYDYVLQNISTRGSYTSHVSSSLIKDNSKEIPVSSNTSKFSIIISQLTDASSCTQNGPITSSPRCLKDVTNEAAWFICKKNGHSSKHSVDINTERTSHCLYDSEQLPIYSNKSTQCPPVIYRSKLSDFIKKSIPDFPIKLKQEIDNNSNLTNHHLNNSKENEEEQENFTETAVKCVSRSLQTDAHTANNPKNQESACIQWCSLESQQSNNAIKNTQKATKNASHYINNNNDKKSAIAATQHVDGSQQADENWLTNNKATCSRQLSNNVDKKENICSASTKQKLHKTEISNNKGHIVSDVSKIISTRKSSGSAINKPAVPKDSRNSDTYTDAYKSRLFACDSCLSLPIQLENKKCTLYPNSFWIPPDYDENEFNVYASKSRLSNCLHLKNNISRQSTQISDINEVESVCAIDKDKTCSDKLSNKNSNNYLKDNRTYSFATLREEYRKASFPTRIIPVALARSQQECQEVSSGPIIPVVLGISQEEYDKGFPSAPVIVTSNEMHSSLDFHFHQTNICEKQCTVNREVDSHPTTVFQEKSFTKNVNNTDGISSKNSEKSITQKESITKQLNVDYQDYDHCPSKTSNCYEQQMLQTMNVKTDKNQDKVYWALTRVKTHRDGSQDFEVLETTPIPPGHFLIPNANSVVLVGNQTFISAENKEVS